MKTETKAFFIFTLFHRLFAFISAQSDGFYFGLQEQMAWYSWWEALTGRAGNPFHSSTNTFPKGYAHLALPGIEANQKSHFRSKPTQDSDARQYKG